MLVQEKAPKENDTHCPARYAGTLRFSPATGLSITGILPNGQALSVSAAMLIGPKGFVGGLNRKHLKPKHTTNNSFDAAAYRNRYRIRPVGTPQGSVASSVGYGYPFAGGPEAVRNKGYPEETNRGVPFSLVTFFWARKRKLLAAKEE